MTAGRWAIGIDLGGTKTEAVALDAAGQERWRQRIATPSAQRSRPGSVGIDHPGGAIDGTHGLGFGPTQQPECINQPLPAKHALR